mgnify:FL=1
MAGRFRTALANRTSAAAVAGVGYLAVVVTIGVAFGWYPSVSELLPFASPFVGFMPTLVGTLGVFLVGAVPAALYERAGLVGPAFVPVALLVLIADTANPESYTVLVFFYPPLVAAVAAVLGAIEYGIRGAAGE